MSSSVTDNCGFEFARVLFMNPSEECHPPLPSSDAFGPEKWATNFQMVPTIHPARCVKIIVCLVTSTGWSLPMAGLCVFSMMHRAGCLHLFCRHDSSSLCLGIFSSSIYDYSRRNSKYNNKSVRAANR